MTGKTLYIHERIARPARAVYDFLAEPDNFPKWASGLGESFQHMADHDWQVDTPMGPMTVRFSPKNDYGIVDHWVIPADGPPMYNPMRVIDLGDACDVVFTLLQRPGMTDAEFDRDADWVRKDLRTLKEILESEAGRT